MAASCFRRISPPRRCWLIILRWLSEAFADAYHVYWRQTESIQTGDMDRISIPAMYSGATELNAARAKLATWSPLSATKRRWLFILSPEDDAIQAAALGREAFAQPGGAIARGGTGRAAAGVDRTVGVPAGSPGDRHRAGESRRLSGCGYLRFMLLLYDAEHVFYWNLFSASMLGRVINQQTVFTFAPGHLVNRYGEIRDPWVRRLFSGRRTDDAESRRATRRGSPRRIGDEQRAFARRRSVDICAIPTPDATWSINPDGDALRWPATLRCAPCW